MWARKFPWVDLLAVVGVVIAVSVISARNISAPTPLTLLNVSYDPTRELYSDLNAHFVDAYAKIHGQRIAVRQSHGGSSHQARLVVSGELQPDVVTLGLPSDVDLLRKHGLLAEDWAARLPNQSHPYYSTIVFVVRSGNPHALHDWPDLIQPGVEVIVPDPKSSGNGKLAALAAWGAVVTRGGNETSARQYLRSLYEHAPFLVPAAREAAVAFSVEKIGDVHLAWENEALREVAESGGNLEIVYPPISILAEPSVAWVDGNVARHGSATLAHEYLDYLFSEEAQQIIARDGYRSIDPRIMQSYARQLPPLKLFQVTAIARDWEDAQARFFGDDGIIDTVYRPKPR
jgi:sulfate/thiosulfate transport system substrate-binding protein